MRDLQAARRAPLNPATSGADVPDGAADADQDPDPASAAQRPEPGPVHRPRLWPLFSSVAVLGLSLDVWTKVEAVARLQPGVGVPLLGDLLTLRLIRNPGAAFSQGEGFAWVFAVAAIVVLGFVLLRLVPRLGHPAWAVALGLLVAGVSGNLVDRLFREPGPFRGHVVDFLQLPHWPIFNVADSCITTAAVMIVVLSLLRNVGIDGRPHNEGAAAPVDRSAT